MLLNDPPNHKCTVCGALWWLGNVDSVGMSWSLRSERCGPCCDNVEMGSQITPLVVHNKKKPFDVYIGRPSKFGNPFSHLPGTLAKYQVASREEAIQRFEEWFKAQPHLMAALGELKGKVLGCWCAPKSCHGDVLVRLANAREETQT